MEIKLAKAKSGYEAIVVLFHPEKSAKPAHSSKAEWVHILAEKKKGQDVVVLQSTDSFRVFVACSTELPDAIEVLRQKGAEILDLLNKTKKKSVLISNASGLSKTLFSFTEGLVLASYQFLRYRTNRKEIKGSLEEVSVEEAKLTSAQISEWNNLLQAVMLSRDLINEPLSYLTAVQFSKEMEKAGKKAGFETTVLHKKQIESLKMGGLLGVNKGSIDPPTFTIMEYKPKQRKNKKPIILVGKGVVFDTGGLSLKPTPASMDEMKCDMSGAAAVVGAMYAIAANELPVHVIALVPATDNRPGMNAIVPQDVLTISDGTTVEVMNTDAEGRLILADALVYARKYKPELVVDLATLTGAAVRAVGSYASAVMGTADQKTMDRLADSGMQVWERMVQFPLWKDYGEELKSDVADLKNLGAGNGGQISAGKFLEHFTDYPWIHIDIAGPAWSNTAQGYRTRGGTGVGVRLLYDFIKNHYAR